MKPTVFLAALLLLFVSSPSMADPGKDDDTARAKAFFKKGTQAYRLANFDEALGHFTEAMKLSPRPSVILNMAQCHRQLDNHKKSLFFYKLYLTEWSRLNTTAKESPPYNKEVAGYIEELGKKLAAPKPKPVEPKPAEPKPVEPKPEPKPEPVEPAPAPQRDEGTSIKKIAGWTFIATGAALTVSGIVLGALASDRSQQMEESARGGGMAFDQDLEDEGKSLNTAMIATLSIGAGAAVGGAILILLHYTDRVEARSANAWLAPSVVPGGAVVAGGWRF